MISKIFPESFVKLEKLFIQHFHCCILLMSSLSVPEFLRQNDFLFTKYVFHGLFHQSQVSLEDFVQEGVCEWKVVPVRLGSWRHKSTPILAWRSRLWRHKSPVYKIFNSRTPSWTKSSRLPWQCGKLQKPCQTTEADWFHVKSEWQKNSEIFSLCVSNSSK